MTGWAATIGIALDHGAPVPLGTQLDWAVRAAVASGRLAPGERLPGLRDLAGELGVNHNTLRAAVARLEADGVLETRHGTGTFVAGGTRAQEGYAELLARAARAAEEAGVSPRELAAALFVTEPEPEPDGERDERRRLREDIGALERVVGEVEARVPHNLAPRLAEVAPAPRNPPGARLLDVAALRDQRAALVRRLAAAQALLEGDAADDPPPPGAPGAAGAPRAEPAPRPVPRPAT